MARHRHADSLNGARRIAVVIFEGLSPFHYAVPHLVFGEDRESLGVPRFSVTACGERRGPVRCASGLTLDAGATYAALERADVVVVPSWSMKGPAPARLVTALQRARASGATIVGLCLGAFVLAEAGLLEGRRATTHWNWAGEFRERFPNVQLDPQVLYVDDGDGVVTSAGTAAGIDCCLHLLRRMCGAEVANRVARRIVIAPHRAGGQAQFVEEPVPRSPTAERLASVLEWAVAHLQQPHSIDSLAKRAVLSRRTFTRQFQKATGESALQWLLRQRLAAAVRLLEGGTQSVEAIADAVGFGSAASLRQHFTRAYGVSPQAFRKQFRIG
jgi:transcriptional regulator GlxA family with amidase domain